MIVHSITVCNWRSIVGQVIVGPLSERITVVHAPNGTGKSSLFEALRRGLLDSHRVTGDKIQQVVPWGRDLSPKVSIEFRANGKDHRISKSFAGNPSSLLEISEAGKYRPLAEGDDADRRTREILFGTPPGRGLTKPEHWGIAQVLWIPQGSVGLEALAGDTQQRIRAVLNTELTGLNRPVEAIIEQRHREYCTETGRRRKSSPVTRIEDRLATARDELAAARAAHAEYEGASEQVRLLLQQRDQVASQLAQRQIELAEAEKTAAQYSSLIATHKQNNSEVQQHESEKRRLVDAIRSREKMEKELQEVRTAIQDLVEQLQEHEALVQSAETEADSARQRVAEATSAQSHAEDLAALAESARTYSEVSGSLAVRNAQYSKVTSALQRLQAQRAVRDAIRAPDPTELRQIDQTHRRLHAAKVAIDSSLIRLSITPIKATHVTITQGEEVGEVHLDADKTARFRGSPRIEVQAEGFGAIHATGPSESVDELRKEMRDAEQRLAALTESFGSSDYDQLAELTRQRVEAEGLFDAISVELESALAGQTREEIHQEVNRLEAEKARLASIHHEWLTQEPAYKELKSQADTQRKVAANEQSEARKSQDICNQKLAAACTELTRIKTLHEQKVARCRQLVEEIETLDSNGESLRVLQERLVERERLLTTARTVAETTGKRLSAYGIDPQGEFERLKGEYAQAQVEHECLQLEAARKEAVLGSLASNGSYSALSSAEERVAQLCDSLEVEATRMEALGLLLSKITESRADLHQLITHEVSDETTKLLHALGAERLGAVAVSEDLVPVAVAPEAAEGEIGLENISGGETEQLYLAARLALAQVLSKEERQLVVLDDVLVATDPQRLARIEQVLSDMSDPLQIVILTCHPDWYTGLQEACKIDLTGLIQEAK